MGDNINIRFDIPKDYENQELYPYVLVILDESLSDADLEGKTCDEVFGLAEAEDQLALGYFPGGDGAPQPFTVSIVPDVVPLQLVDLKVLADEMAY